MGKRKRIKVEGVKVLQTLKKEKKKHEKNIEISVELVSRKKDDEVPERMVAKFVG